MFVKTAESILMTPERLPTYRERLNPLCDRLIQTAMEIAAQSKITLTEHGVLDPKILSLTVLCRTISNFKGVVILIKENLVVEARTLARCCYENMFVVGGLYTEGVAFAERMKADDRAGRKGRIKFAFETEGIAEALSTETREQMKKALEHMNTLPKGALFKPKEVSGTGPFGETYVAYSQFSGDATHATLMALSRHWTFQGSEVIFDVAAPVTNHMLDETLHLSCIAFLSVMVAVNEMQGYTDAGKKLAEINGELKALQDERWGSEEISEGFEIKTGPTS